jgi:hypothetical protein
MSFLGGLGSVLSPALTTATQAYGAEQNAQAQSADVQQQRAVQQIQMLRQAHEQQIKDALTQAQTAEAQSHSTLYGTEADPAFAGQKALAERQATEPFDIDKAQRDLTNRLSEIKAQGGSDMAVAQARIAGEQQINAANIAAAAARQTNQQQYETSQLPIKAANTTAEHLAGIQETQAGNPVTAVGRFLHIIPQAKAPVTPGSVNAAGVPLADRVAQLHTYGLSDQAILQQMKDEGYDVTAPAGKGSVTAPVTTTGPGPIPSPGTP